MLPTFCHETRTWMPTCANSKVSSPHTTALQQTSDSDPLVVIFSSTSVVVGKGSSVQPLYTVCCPTSVITDLLNTALHAAFSAKGSEADAAAIDVDGLASSQQGIATALLPSDITSIVRGESLVVVYPLSWSHTQTGELELLSSFVFSTLGAATAMFIAAPLAAAYGLGIGLVEGDEWAARPSGLLPVVGMKRSRGEGMSDAQGATVVDCDESTSSNWSRGPASELEDSTSDRDSDDDSSASTKTKKRRPAKGTGGPKANTAVAKRSAHFKGRLVTVQIDAASITVSHVAAGSVQRFVRLSVGRERANRVVDASPVLKPLAKALDALTSLEGTGLLVSAVVGTFTAKVRQTLAVLQQASEHPPTLTDLFLAHRDASAHGASSHTLSSSVDTLVRLCASTDVLEEIGYLEQVVATMCQEARRTFSVLLSDSYLLGDLFRSTGVIGNAIDKLEAKLEADSDGRAGEVSLVALGGEVVGWLQMRERVYSGALIAAVRESPRRIVVPSEWGQLTKVASPLVEFQGASLVATIADREFHKVSMSVAEYLDKGATHVRWRCAR